MYEKSLECTQRYPLPQGELVTDFQKTLRHDQDTGHYWLNLTRTTDQRAKITRGHGGRYDMRIMTIISPLRIDRRTVYPVNNKLERQLKQHRKRPFYGIRESSRQSRYLSRRHTES